MARGMERNVPNLRMVLIEDCGHWTQQERPDEVSRAMIAFLKDTGR
jgi:pimeloyl-ACP methyl ester carboxylesterase